MVKRITLLIVVVIAPLFVTPAHATGCNPSNGSCHSATILSVLIDGGGRVHFMVDTPEVLASVAEINSCTFRQEWSVVLGVITSSVYLAPDDPHFELKNALLTTAWMTGKTVGFSLQEDPSTGWCKIARINVY